MNPDNTYIFYQGKRLRVEFYFSDKGDLPAKEYLEKLSVKVKAKLAAFVKLIADEGRLYDEKKFRLVSKVEKIYEFKPLGYRFFNFFYSGGRLIITNGYFKKTRKVEKRELKKAVLIKKDYEDRINAGSYYA